MVATIIVLKTIQENLLYNYTVYEVKPYHRTIKDYNNQLDALQLNDNQELGAHKSYAMSRNNA